MIPTDVGRHCAACQAQVVDYTRMTDGEVVAFLSQYHPVRRCGRFREDQMGRQLLAAARPLAGWRRWAGAAVLLLGSVLGMKARAQGSKPGVNAGAMLPAATRTTYSGVADSLLLVRGEVRNRWGLRQPGAWATAGGIRDSTDAKGYFQLLVPKRKLGHISYVRVFYRNSEGEVLGTAKVAFDSARTEPYRIKLEKPPVVHNIGFH